MLCVALYNNGAWDEGLSIADDLIAQLERGGSASYFEYHLRSARSRIRLARAVDDELALADARRAVEVGRSAKDRQALIPMLSNMGFIAAELGQLDEAREAARELSSVIVDASPVNAHRTLEIAWFADSLGCAEALRRLARTAPQDHVWRGLVLAVLDLDFERAAATCAALGHVDEGYARLRAGEHHLEEGQLARAEDQLRRALTLYRPLDAVRYVSQAERLLADAGLQVSA